MRHLRSITFKMDAIEPGMPVRILSMTITDLEDGTYIIEGSGEADGVSITGKTNPMPIPEDGAIVGAFQVTAHGAGISESDWDRLLGNKQTP